MKRPSAWVLLLVPAVLTGCGSAFPVKVSGVTFTVPGNWHQTTSVPGATSQIGLIRAQLPFVARASAVDVAPNPEEDVPGAEQAGLWRDGMGKVLTGARYQNVVQEEYDGRYKSLCVNASKPDGTLIMDCEVTRTPLLFMFAGSAAGKREAIDMLKSMR